MPTYGYECTACKDQIEVFQSIKDDPLTICQECGGELRKKVYPVGIAFKGPGFYVNDYAKKSSSSATASSTPAKAESASSESTSETKAEAKSDAKTETKTEAKTESKSPAAAAA
jgi:putative FmdB family regulatory protein